MTSQTTSEKIVTHSIHTSTCSDESTIVILSSTNSVIVTIADGTHTSTGSDEFTIVLL